MKVEKLMEANDAARALGVSSQSVANYADAGVLPLAFLTMRGCRLFYKADVMRLARKRRG